MITALILLYLLIGLSHAIQGILIEYDSSRYIDVKDIFGMIVLGFLIWPIRAAVIIWREGL